MFPIQDQISVATKASLESQFALYNLFTRNTLESIEKLVNLNMTAFKASMEESVFTTKQILAAKDPQEFISLVGAQSKPAFEKALAYSNHVAGIASSAQAEFTKAAETQFAELSRKTNEVMNDAATKLPVGSDSIMAALKSAFGNVNAGYEQFSKSAKKTMETAEPIIATAAAPVSQAAEPKIVITKN